MTIYERAERNGVMLECTCVDCTPAKWERLMKGAKRADRKQVIKAAFKAGIIFDTYEKNQELKKPYYNPYHHYKTDTHLIYVHSGIEHFIKVNS